jgi:hypothetical protein
MTVYRNAPSAKARLYFIRLTGISKDENTIPMFRKACVTYYSAFAEMYTEISRFVKTARRVSAGLLL